MPARSRRERFIIDRRPQIEFAYEAIIYYIANFDDRRRQCINAVKHKNGLKSRSPSGGKQNGSKQTNDEDEVQHKLCPAVMWGEGIPTELLVQIFSMVVDELPFLCRVSGVCRSWRNAASNSSLRREVDLTKFKKKAPRTFRYRLADHRLSRVAKLNLSRWRQLKLEDYRFLFDSSRQFHSLDLSYCNLTRSTIKALRSLPNLQNLNISVAPDAIMVPAVLCPVLQSLGPRLRELNLSDNHIRGCVAIINTLMDNCPNLTMLYLSACKYSSSENSLTIEKLQGCCPKLRILRLQDTEIFAGKADEEDVLASFGFPDLEELNVSVSVSLVETDLVFTYDDDFLDRALNNSRNLRDLNVSACINVSSNSLLTIPTQHLKNLRLSGCFECGIYTGILDTIYRWKHSLENVDLSWNDFWPGDLDQALYVMGQYGTPVRSLNLAGTSASRESVRTVLTGCRQLTTLDLTSFRGMPE